MALKDREMTGKLTPFPNEVRQVESKLREFTKVRVASRRQSPKRAAWLETKLPDDLGQAIASIRASLGLSITELADVVHATRQTIYAWIRGENEPQAENRKRLQHLYGISKFWNSRSNLPAKQHLSDLFVILKRNDLSPETVLERLDEASRRRGKQKTPPSRLASLLAERGIDIDDLPDQDGQL